MNRAAAGVRMTTEAAEIQRIVSAAVRDMLDASRIQAKAGPVTDKALEQILFRAAHGISEALALYSMEQRGALLPSVVRMLMATVLEDVAGRGPGEKGAQRAAGG